MKLAVMSDVHSNIFGLRLALEDAKKMNVDKFVFLGDYITDGFISNEIIDLIKEYGDYVIIGNREEYILNYDSSRKYFNNYKTITSTYNSLNEESINYLKSLKEVDYIYVNNYKILILHGDKYNAHCNDLDYDQVIEDYKDFDICLYGHFHYYKDMTYKGKRFINPGSIGIPCDSPSYKYCILDINDRVDVTLREFNTNDTYQDLLYEFLKSDYYKTNIIWSNLVLNTIKYGRDCCYDFISLLKTYLDSNREYSSEEFNKIWDDTYDEFIKIYKFE